MCDLSEKLIAWLDRELPENEAGDVERHIQTCAECANRLHLYKEVDKALDAYCDKAMVSTACRRLPRWVPVMSGVAAAVALLLIFPRGGHVERLPFRAPVASTPTVLEIASAPVNKRIHRRPAVAPPQPRYANWMPSEPAIQIAIPAGAMFAPGAIPDGVSLTAEFSIAADGSAQSLRLQP